jgi:hypothetical protein
MSTSRIAANAEATSGSSKSKGLRTRVRAGDNPGMGPYNGQNTCTVRVYYGDDGAPAYVGVDCKYT